MIGEPALREDNLERSALRVEIDVGQRRRAAAAIQQHGEPQQHDQQFRLDVPGRNQLLDRLEMQLAPMTANDRGEQMLLLCLLYTSPSPRDS